MVKMDPIVSEQEEYYEDALISIAAAASDGQAMLEAGVNPEVLYQILRDIEAMAVIALS